MALLHMGLGQDVLSIEAHDGDGHENGEDNHAVGHTDGHVFPDNHGAQCINPGAAIVGG